MDTLTKLTRPEILALKPYSSARKEGEQQRMSIFLDANENPCPPYPGTKECEGLQRYPEPQPQHLLDLFATHYQVEREKLLITRGADEAIDLLVRAFCNAGKDGILINTPAFAMYEFSAQVQHATVHPVALLKAENFQLDVERILTTCRDNPTIKLVFVCTPNNPTGQLMSRADVFRLSKELLGRTLVIADEAYVEFSEQPSLCTEVKSYPNLVVLRTLSKEYSLAGERCGVTIAHPDIISIIGRILAPYPLTVSAIRAITLAMSPEGVKQARANIKQILEQKKLVEHALQGTPAAIRIYPSDTNYLLIETPKPKLLVQMMEKAGIKIRDRSTVPGIEGCVRFSIGTPQHNQALLKVFKEYTQNI